MKDPYLLAASMSVAWVMKFEQTPERALQLRTELSNRSAIVSHLWRFEMLNFLATSLRTKRLLLAEATAYANEIRHFTPYIADEGDPALILSLCHEYSLSAYDASYLAIALGGGWPIATLDKALIKAAQVTGVAVL